ncbi:hypothetical protein [Nocardia sp. CC227C]|uniref:hypothetical protein n=1 Tax=Nocardia sp. CC227C TaxID=3044562 RepID=UPI00278C486E|nr:hypothetical protein [Nocardia sp. CC227C]
MHRNDIRAAVFGATTGLIAGLAPILFVEFELDTRIGDAVDRWRLSPADRAEYDRIRRERAEHRAAKVRKQEQAQAAIRARFRPDLLTGPQTELAQLSLRDLVEEINHAKVHRIAAVNEAGGSATVTSMWDDQVRALRSEFQRREGEPMSILDRDRYYAASQAVNDPWPLDSSPTLSPLTPAPVSDFGTPTFRPYPDFAGPDTADEAQTITTDQE